MPKVHTEIADVPVDLMHSATVLSNKVALIGRGEIGAMHLELHLSGTNDEPTFTIVGDGVFVAVIRISELFEAVTAAHVARTVHAT